MNTDSEWEIRPGRWQDSPPDKVDHVISDPPYNERSHKSGMRGTGESGIATSAPKSFPSVDPADFAADLVDRCRRWCICFCAVEMLGDYMRAVGDDRYIRSGAWKKKNPTPQFTGDRPGVWGDGIAIMHSRERCSDGTLREPLRWHGGTSPAIWECRTHNPGRFGTERRIHETQKPLDLMIALVRDFTDPGDLIWDPYCGSGTTGVAAILTGRDFLGHELQDRYVDVAMRRIEAESSGLRLEDVQHGQEPLFASGDND